MEMRTRALWLFSLLPLLIAAIVLLPPDPPVRASARTTSKEVKKLSIRKIKRLPGWKTYKKLCADCHGDKGDGKGILAQTMQPPPVDYRKCDVIGHLSDVELRKVILDGGPAIGKSQAMQGFRKKLKDPKVVEQLIFIIRSFGGCSYQGKANSS